MPVNINNESVSNEEIKKLLEENLELTRETQKMVKKVKNHIVLEQFFSIIKILIIVVPLILAYLYLPTILKPYIEQYQQVMQGAGMVTPDINEALK